jgi:hypothetical protein
MYTSTYLTTFCFIAATFAQIQISVDDTDPAIIYSPGWNRADHDIPAVFSGIYNATDTYSDVTGATATYTFVGTR